MLTATLVAVLCVLGQSLVSGQSGASSGPSPITSYVRPSYFPKSGGGGSYGPPTYYHYDYAAEAELDLLLKVIATLEGRDALQYERIRTLTHDANANVDFRNNFVENTLGSIENEQSQQNYVLNDIDQKIKVIRQLRQDVNEATYRVNHIRDFVQANRKERRVDMDAISALINADTQRLNRYEEIKERADNINDRLDRLLKQAWENNLYGDQLERNIRRSIDAANAQKGLSVSYYLEPYSDKTNSVIDFVPDLLGVPVSSATPVGFRIVRSHSYNDYYPAIYFATSQDLMNTQDDNGAVDMSTGGIEVEKIHMRNTYVYISTVTLYKENIPHIPTSTNK